MNSVAAIAIFALFAVLTDGKTIGEARSCVLSAAEQCNSECNRAIPTDKRAAFGRCFQLIRPKPRMAEMAFGACLETSGVTDNTNCFTWGPPPPGRQQQAPSPPLPGQKIHLHNEASSSEEAMPQAAKDFFACERKCNAKQSDLCREGCPLVTPEVDAIYAQCREVTMRNGPQEDFGPGNQMKKFHSCIADALN